MKTPKFNVLFVFILFTNILIAQDYKLGKVTVAELEEKEHPIDKDAPAAYLFQIGKSSSCKYKRSWHSAFPL